MLLPIRKVVLSSLTSALVSRHQTVKLPQLSDVWVADFFPLHWTGNMSRMLVWLQPRRSTPVCCDS